MGATQPLQRIRRPSIHSRHRADRRRNVPVRSIRPSSATSSSVGDHGPRRGDRRRPRPGQRPGAGGGLRQDDVASVAIGIVPGAVIGGPLGYLILDANTFGPEPAALLDPRPAASSWTRRRRGVHHRQLRGQPAGTPVGRWLHVAMAPTLFVLGAGKLTMVLTGTGRDRPASTTGRHATSDPVPGVPAAGAPIRPVAGLGRLATLAILVALTVALMIARSSDA